MYQRSQSQGWGIQGRQGFPRWSESTPCRSRSKAEIEKMTQWVVEKLGPT